MRTIIMLLTLLTLQTARAQSTKFTIEGTVQKNKSAKFAYLVSTGSTPGKSDLFLVRPMVDNSFSLSGAADLEGKLLRKGFIFLDDRGDITLNQVRERINKKVWFVGGSANLKSIYLEDLRLEGENPYNLASATISYGGNYLQQSNNALQAIRERKFIDFVKKNPDSPVALDELSKMVNLFGFDVLKTMEFGSPNEMFAALSKRLKGTVQGIELRKKIEQHK